MSTLFRTLALAALLFLALGSSAAFAIIVPLPPGPTPGPTFPAPPLPPPLPGPILILTQQQEDLGGERPFNWEGEWDMPEEFSDGSGSRSEEMATIWKGKGRKWAHRPRPRG